MTPGALQTPSKIARPLDLLLLLPPPLHFDCSPSIETVIGAGRKPTALVVVVFAVVFVVDVVVCLRSFHPDGSLYSIPRRRKIEGADSDEEEEGPPPMKSFSLSLSLSKRSS